MLDKANEYAKAEDAVHASKQSGSSWKNKDCKDNKEVSGSGSNNNNKDRKRKPEDLVAVTSQSSYQRLSVSTYDKIMNGPYSHLPNSKHAAKDCFIYKQFAEQYAS